MTPDRFSDFDADIRRYEALLEMADLLVHHGSLPELFEELGGRLRGVTPFDFANFSLHDPKKNQMRLHILEGTELKAPREMPVEDAATGWVWQNQQPLIFPDLQAESRFPALFKNDARKGVAVLLRSAAYDCAKTYRRARTGQFPPKCLWGKRCPSSAAGRGACGLGN